MKNKIFKASVIFFVIIALILVNVVPIMANVSSVGSPFSNIAPIPPLSDPSKANYNSATINNILDPTNPNYNPIGIYGPKGTRFSPPTRNSSPLISSLEDEDHLEWGTEIDNSSTSNLFGIYGYQAVYNTINLNDNGDVLYAPTMRGPNGCPLEMTTAYIKSGTTTNSSVELFDFNSWTFVAQTTINSSFISNYVRSGSYVGELLYSSTLNEWHAYLYNWNTYSWDGFWNWDSPLMGVTMGWDMWEEYYLANNWPTLPEIYSNYLTVRVGNSGNDWERVTSAYGSILNGNMTSEYPYGFLANYYEWYVGPGS